MEKNRCIAKGCPYLRKYNKVNNKELLFGRYVKDVHWICLKYGNRDVKDIVHCSCCWISLPSIGLHLSGQWDEALPLFYFIDCQWFVHTVFRLRLRNRFSIGEPENRSSPSCLFFSNVKNMLKVKKYFVVSKISFTFVSNKKTNSNNLIKERVKRWRKKH